MGQCGSSEVVKAKQQRRASLRMPKEFCNMATTKSSAASMGAGSQSADAGSQSSAEYSCSPNPTMSLDALCREVHSEGETDDDTSEDVDAHCPPQLPGSAPPSPTASRGTVATSGGDSPTVALRRRCSVGERRPSLCGRRLSVDVPCAPLVQLPPARCTDAASQAKQKKLKRQVSWQQRKEQHRRIRGQAYTTHARHREACAMRVRASAVVVAFAKARLATLAAERKMRQPVPATTASAGCAQFLHAPSTLGHTPSSSSGVSSSCLSPPPRALKGPHPVKFSVAGAQARKLGSRRSCSSVASSISTGAIDVAALTLI
eukprot:Rhum_TRINITY_DN9043_c0_g1::Rhum_TRINITY_DN9043_c0_g1_i1::g.31308::m.31308